MTNDITLFCGPYDCEKDGFYFSSLVQYEQRAKASGAEEFWFDWIDGNEILANIFRFYQVGQCELQQFFEQVVNAGYSIEQLLSLQYLAEWGKATSLAEGIGQLENVIVHQCSLQDFVVELVSATFFDVMQLLRDDNDLRLDREGLFWRLLDAEKCETELLADRPDVEVYKVDGREYVLEYVE